MFRENRISSLNLFIFVSEQTPYHTHLLLLSSKFVFLHLFIVIAPCLLDLSSPTFQVLRLSVLAEG